MCTYCAGLVIDLFIYAYKAYPKISISQGGLRGRDRKVVGFRTTHTISAYHINIVSSNLAQARCNRYNIV
jgi:hypothetical protein